ncbi:MAG: carboxypeptidase regulatory-like domain-containing protein [Acidobacteria bacterium]|nr:carboxypeptidase regulatory-like domain-containing protein [Acidobacteriota bacterium]
MKSAVTFLLLVLIFSATINVVAQTARNNPPKTPGSISGRITVGNDPATGVEVILKQSGNSPIPDLLQSGPSATATTDSSGWYRLSGVAPGSYRIVAYAPAYVIEGESNPFQPGKTVNLAEAENIETVDFSLTRGGVLTGKVTDPDDRPVIAEAVRAYKLGVDGKRNSTGIPDFSTWQTDDRGVYRIFGLDPGRYIIAAGASSEDALLRMGAGASGTYYRRTFYPQAVEEAQAKIIEVRAGGEVENVDIKLAPSSKNKTFAATGRVIEADTGKPVAGVMIGYGVTKQGSASFGFGGSATNSAGEFRLEGLTPNSYNAYVIGIEASENYGESLNFEITDSDVSGLELKMRQGASISGVAVLEGANDPKLREKLTKISVNAYPISGGGTFVASNLFGGTGQISADGSFKIGGIHPGKVQLIANTFLAEKGFSLSRVENNGVVVKELEVNAGDRLTGIRLVFAYGTASIAGRVEIQGGTLPPGVKLMVRAQREGMSEDLFGTGNAEIDARGQFLIEGLAVGTYKLKLLSVSFAPGDRVKLPPVEQTVAVAANSRQEVVLVLDLSKEEK